MNADQLRDLIIVPTLKYIQHNSLGAQNLILMTFAAESDLGKYIKQINGSALGLGQMEKDTFYWLTDDFLKQPKYLLLRRKISDLASGRYCGLDFEDLAGNLPFAVAMTRVKYLSIDAELPAPDDIEGMAIYYKRYYNTEKGASTIPKTIEKYKQLVLEKRE